MNSINDNFRKQIEVDYHGHTFGMDIPNDVTASAIKMLMNEAFEALQLRLHLYNSMCRLPNLCIQNIRFFIHLKPESVGNKSVTYIVPTVYLNLLQKIVETSSEFSVENWDELWRRTNLSMSSKPCSDNGRLANYSEVCLTW